MAAQERVVLLFGRTGNGKSTLANVITGTSRFVESPYGTSQTKDMQQEEVVVGDTCFKVVDVVGLGDTSLPEQEVLYKIADTCHAVRDGLHQIFFVIGNKFTEEEIFAFNILRAVIFSNDVLKYTTIVRTKFPGFRKPEMCDTDRERIRSETPALQEILQTCKMIHVNNLTLDEDEEQKSRKDSQTILRTHLRNCREIYKPVELDEITDRITKHMEDKHKLENKLRDLTELMKKNEEHTAQLKVQMEQDRRTAATELKKVIDLRDQKMIQIQKEAQARMEAEMRKRDEERAEQQRQHQEQAKQLQNQINEAKQNAACQVAAVQAQAPRKKRRGLFGWGGTVFTLGL